jgi:hypothetical protein
MKKIILVFFLLMGCLNAFDKVSLEYGYKNNIDVYGIALQKDFDYKLFDIAKLAFDISAQHISGEDDSLTVISAQPLINIDLSKKIYFEAGVGGAYFSKDYLDHKKFGMHFQFKESVGFGYRFTDNFEATLKYNHYSNANLDDDNAGLDFFGIKVAYKF